jgi:hypothetical protein
MNPTQEQIFRRRRVAALVILALLITIIWGLPQLFASNGGSIMPTNSSSPTQAAGDLAECAPGTVIVSSYVGSLEGTKQSFAADETPYFWYEIVNTGDESCKFNVGAQATFFSVTSGETLIWTSKQCSRAGLTELWTELKPKVSLASEKAPWDKVWSSETGCSAETERSVTTDGASYYIKVEVAGQISENSQQFLLN